MSAAKRAILPFFIPMQGCAYHCVYCDQHSISGQEAPPTPAEIAAAALAYCGDEPAQLAFYGGSFTALPWQQQQAYLEAAQPALNSGQISSLRISTRPDALDQTLLEKLAAYGVTTIELGLQSLDAGVLAASGRAYSPQTAQQACRLVQAAGLELGLQLMCGLPGDSRVFSLRSMAQACELRPDFFRVYPTLVLSGTPLALLYAEGRYQPQTLPEAAELAGDMLALALAAGLPVIRLGLNPSPSLEAALLAGPYHPSFGQLARGALKLKQAQTLLGQAYQLPALLLFPPRERSLLCGQKNAQLLALKRQFTGLEIAEQASLAPGALALQLSGGRGVTLAEADFLRLYAAVLAAEICG